MVQECKMGKDMDLQERVRLKKADRSELYSLTPPFPKTNFLIDFLCVLIFEKILTISNTIANIKHNHILLFKIKVVRAQ